MAVTLGTRLGPYEILARIGTGGVGEVYKARDTRLDRIVAIKVLRKHVAADAGRRARFEREARVIAQLNHPHICTLFDVGQEQDADFLVMECLDGQTLADRLLKSPLPIDQALQHAIQIVDALDAAHRRGIVHRDLKPANVMLTKTGAKLLDFGIAKAFSAPAARAGGSGSDGFDGAGPATRSTLTAEGTLLGTVHYIAPEQLEGRDADTRSDIFAFGAVLYEMITGRRAFAGESQASVVAAILEVTPPRISTERPLIPPALDRVTSKCLAKDPETRWQTARDLMDELKWIADGMRTTLGVSAAPLGGRWASPAWLVATVAVVAAIVIWVLALRRPADDLPVMRFDVATPPAPSPTSFALSPDGNQLAFVAMAEGVSRLWLRPFNQTMAQPIAGTDGATFPFWAPDSRSLGFFAGGKLKRVDVAGGAPEVLADAAGDGGGTWNRDGVILFGQGVGGVMRVAATGGGTTTAVTRPTPGEYRHLFPVFLPDGRQFLFFVGSGARPEVRGEYLGSLDASETHRLAASDSAAAYAPGHLLVMREGALMAIPFDAVRGVLSGEPVPVAQAVGSDPSSAHAAFSVSLSGLLGYRTGGPTRRHLVWINRIGAPMGVLLPSNENQLRNPELAPDDQHVSVSQSVRGNMDVWLIDTARGVSSRLTSNPAGDSGALWSPDGSRIIFSSNRNGVFDLFEKPASGTRDEEPVIHSSDNKMPADWSPDGHFFLYDAQDSKTRRWHVWALPLEGARKPFPVRQTDFSEDFAGQFSPDGRWIAYQSDESGRREIYVTSFPGPGRTWIVSTAGGKAPRWRRDGRELFYVASNGTLMAVPIGLPADGQTVTLGAPVPLFRTHLVDAGVFAPPQYAVAHDGQRFLMNVVDDDAPAWPITIVQNWTAGLKK